MGEPRTIAEGARLVRRALYDIARLPEAHPEGATQAEIINHALARKWRTIPVSAFDDAIVYLGEAGALIDSGFVAVAVAESNLPIIAIDQRFRLSAKGEIDEERARRLWPLLVWDELSSPRRGADIVIAIVSGLIGLVIGIVGASIWR
ncbi:MAG: hypothetical protein ACRDF0_05200 [Candidatus Limnocylindria bacterium]